MFTDAEKIIIHLTPFVLGINLDVIVFNDNEDKKIKNMIYAGDSDYNFNDDKIFVLNINGHYELLYSEEDNTRNTDIFKNYINDYYSNIRIKENIKEEINNKIENELKKEEDEKEIEIENHENNILIESSSIPSKESSNKKEKKEEDKINNIIEEEKEKEEEIKEENNNINEDKTKYKVQIKIINRTAIKSKNKFYNEKENNENSKVDLTKIKYSEKKDTNYKNLINNKIIEKNNNNIEQDNEENNINKSINLPKVNLIEMMTKEDKDLEDKNEIEDNNNNIIRNTNEKEEKTFLNTIIHQDKQDNVNENSEIQLIKCKICSENNIKENKNEIFNDVCKNCLKTIIINELNEKYISYIENLISEKMLAPAFITYFDEFLESKLNIMEQNISIKNALNILDNNFKSNLEMHPVFQKIKKQFCIFCLSNIKETKYEIPCKCNFCCIDHIKKYFHMKNSFKSKNNYFCICSHQYSLKNIYNIGIFFLQNKLYSLKEDIIDFLNLNYLSKQCCFCSVSLEHYNIKRVKIKDLKDELVLGDTNKLKHLQCLNCFLQYKNNVEKFFCFICNKEHMIIDN